MMGVREHLNRHRRLTIGASAVVIALVTGLIVLQSRANRKMMPTSLPDAYYSVDDGKSFFAANSENVAPFIFEGKTAVRAYVFECDGRRFVGYLERYTPEARTSLARERQSTPELQMYGREFKKPGDQNWVKSGDLAGVAAVTEIRCPGGHGTPQPVEP